VLSHTAEYAMRAALYLAQNEGRMVPATEIADALDVPHNYLSKVLNALRREGVLVSGRGALGGFRLHTDSSFIRLAQVVRPFGVLGGVPRCLLLDRPCSDRTPCIAHHEWKRVAHDVHSFFDTRTLADLLQSGRPGATRDADDRSTASLP
jgi:Rrf2 family protein